MGLVGAVAHEAVGIVAFAPGQVMDIGRGQGGGAAIIQGTRHGHRAGSADLEHQRVGYGGKIQVDAVDRFVRLRSGSPVQLQHG